MPRPTHPRPGTAEGRGAFLTEFIMDLVSKQPSREHALRLLDRLSEPGTPEFRRHFQDYLMLHRGPDAGLSVGDVVSAIDQVRMTF